MKIESIVAGCVLLLVVAAANSQGVRFKPLPENEMNDAQKQAVKEMLGGLRGSFNWDGPNALLLRSPELQGRTQRVGEYLRYKSAIGQRLSEFAILITARKWDAQGEWLAHEALVAKAGIATATIADLKQGRRPGGMQEDEALVYQFLTELHATKTVSDATFAAAKNEIRRTGRDRLNDGVGLLHDARDDSRRGWKSGAERYCAAAADCQVMRITCG
ncbi:MAG: carboxymuconolactone decarboxylase [Betaproteobacteria bacterium]|nr:carboxymuconolactone decarboxylase [Betaproteobacteria bacterium]